MTICQILVLSWLPEETWGSEETKRGVERWKAFTLSSDFSNESFSGDINKLFSQRISWGLQCHYTQHQVGDNLSPSPPSLQERQSSAGVRLSVGIWQRDVEQWVRGAAQQLSVLVSSSLHLVIFGARDIKNKNKKRNQKKKKKRKKLMIFNFPFNLNCSMILWNQRRVLYSETEMFLQSLIKLLNLCSRQLSIALGKMKHGEVKGLTQGQWWSHK